MARFISLPLMLFGLLCQLSAQLDPNDPNELLRRAIAQVRNRLVRLSNYVCTQTTDRIVLPGRPGCYGGPPPDRFRLSQSDRVRVDVLSTSSGELYSWPGENRFYSQDPFQLVGLLPLSTGGFSGLLRSVFGNDNAFLYAGEVTENGRKLRQFSFRVPRESSQYWFGTRSHDWRTVAFGGTFLLDPETADLVRLVVNVSESPEATGACQATTTLSYGRTPVNEWQSVLPASALFELFTTLGLEVRNSSAYSGCHEFAAQSTVRFEAPDTGLRPVEKAPERPALALPEGVPFRIVFTQDIKFRTVAAGDTIAARLATPIVDQSGHVLVPADAPVVTRILNAEFFRIQRDGRPVLMGTLIFRLESLAIAGAMHPFVATTAQQIEDCDPLPGEPPKRVSSTVTTWVHDGDVASLLLAPNTASLMICRVRPDFVLKAGKQSKWKTGGTGPTPGCLTGASRCK